MNPDRIKRIATTLGIDMAEVETKLAALMVNTGAIAIAYIDGKAEIRVLDSKQIYGLEPGLMIFDDFSRDSRQLSPINDELLRCYDEPMTQSAESERLLKARDQANRRTKEAKKPIPYYHGHRRRF